MPLIPEFKDFIIDAFIERRILIPLEVLSIEQNFDAYMLYMRNDEQDVIDIVNQGLAQGKISIPSADLTKNNFKQYIELPDYIEKKFEKGKISMAHFSDLLRISLLAKWGGMWIDSTALCTDEDFFRYASKQRLFVFKQLNLGNQ